MARRRYSLTDRARHKMTHERDPSDTPVSSATAEEHPDVNESETAATGVALPTNKGEVSDLVEVSRSEGTTACASDSGGTDDGVPNPDTEISRRAKFET